MPKNHDLENEFRCLKSGKTIAREVKKQNALARVEEKKRQNTEETQNLFLNLKCSVAQDKQRKLLLEQTKQTQAVILLQEHLHQKEVERKNTINNEKRAIDEYRTIKINPNPHKMPGRIVVTRLSTPLLRTFSMSEESRVYAEKFPLFSELLQASDDVKKGYDPALSLRKSVIPRQGDHIVIEVDLDHLRGDGDICTLLKNALLVGFDQSTKLIINLIVHCGVREEKITLPALSVPYSVRVTINEDNHHDDGINDWEFGRNYSWAGSVLRITSTREVVHLNYQEECRHGRGCLPPTYTIPNNMTDNKDRYSLTIVSHGIKEYDTPDVSITIELMKN